MDCFGTYFTHAQRCENLRVQSATEISASVYNLHAQIFDNVFIVLRNGLLRYILYTCPKVWKPSCSKCSSTEWAASVHTLHIPKGVKTFVFKVLQKGLLRYIFYACPKLWWRSCSKWYGMGCFGTYFTHAQSCDNVRVQSAAEWTASVQNQTTRTQEPFLPFSSFRVSMFLCFSHLRASLFDC